MSRLIRSSLSLSRFKSSVATIKDGRFLYTDSNKVEAAETVNVPTEKLLVLGGNGFVGSHVGKGPFNRGLIVASLSRTGTSSIQRSWANNGIWNQGNLLSTDSWKGALKGVTSVNSSIRGFGSNAHMYKINRTANINAIKATAEEGVILRPGFIRGSRCVGSMSSSLGETSSPPEKVEQDAKPQAHQAPSFRPLSPHLSVYKPQLSSTLSISHRISYVIVFSVAMLSYLVCLKMGPICFTHWYFYQSLFYASKVTPLITDVTALALFYVVVHHFMSVYGQLQWLRK